MASRNPPFLHLRGLALELADWWGGFLMRRGAALSRRGKRISDQANERWADLIEQTEGRPGP